MGCFLHITENDREQISASLSAPKAVEIFSNFNQVFKSLNELERNELNKLLHDRSVSRGKLVAALSNAVSEDRAEVAKSIIRDTNEVLKAVGKPDGLLDRDVNKSVYDRLASNKNEFNGARFELKVAADVIRGNSQLQKAGVFFSPMDKVSFGKKIPTNTTQFAKPTHGGQTFFSFAARRSQIEADVLVENKNMFGIVTQRIAIDSKWRSHGNVALDASRPSTLFEPGRQPQKLEDELRAVVVAIEQKKLDRFVVVTNRKFGGPVHEYVGRLNDHLADKGQGEDSIVLVEHLGDG
jgi:hypothetical protein